MRSTPQRDFRYVNYETIVPVSRNPPLLFAKAQMITRSFISPLLPKSAPLLHKRLQKVARCTLNPSTEQQKEHPHEQQPQLQPQRHFSPTIPRKHSLPTHRERLYLQSLYFARPKGRAPHYARVQNMSLMAWPLIQLQGADSAEPIRAGQEVPPWAYIVRVRASKSVFGKRAVVRNRAKRRVKAAAARIMPGHAKRGLEYVFAPFQGALTADFEDLVDDIEECLRSIGAWRDELTSKEVVREVYCDRYR